MLVFIAISIYYGNGKMIIVPTILRNAEGIGVTGLQQIGGQDATSCATFCTGIADVVGNGIDSEANTAW